MDTTDLCSVFARKGRHLGHAVIVLVFVVIMMVVIGPLLSESSGQGAEDNEPNLSIGLHARDKEITAKPTRKPRSKRSIKNAETGGALYIRWGRSVCPDDPYTELVYAGYAGGSYNGYEGSASNLLCMSPDPLWNRYNDSAATNTAYLYGTEYWDDSLLGRSNAENILYHDVPCAVCRSKQRSSVLMIPGRNACYTGWHLEYPGYLMAGNHKHKAASQYVCVDDSPEAEPKGYQGQGGAYLYHVEGRCGSLACPPYVTNRELTCAVCTNCWTRAEASWEVKAAEPNCEVTGNGARDVPVLIAALPSMFVLYIYFLLHFLFS